MTPAAHLLSGYLVGEWQASGEKERWRAVAAAVVAGIAPDFDVVLGLLGGWAGSGAHRGATHSLTLAPLFAWLIAKVVRGPRRPVFLAALGGIISHIFWDWLNPWGAILFWPWMRSFRGNLVHEGNLYVLGLLLGSAVLVWRGRRVAAAVLLLELLPVFLLVQIWWRDHARGLAAAQLAGRRALVYPAPDLACGWIALSAGSADMSVACVASPVARRLRPVFTTPVRGDFFVQASERSPVVQDLREKIPFAFAEVRPLKNGGAVVLWRDLRVAYREPKDADPTGLQVELDAHGKIVSEHYRWWLRLW